MASDDEMWWEELERAEAEVLSPGSEEVEEFFRRQAVALRSPSSSSVPSSRRWRDLRWRHRMLEASESPTRLGWADSPTSEEEEEETSEEVAVEEEGSQQSEEEVAVEEEGSQQSEEVAMAVEEKEEEVVTEVVESSGEEVVVEEEVAMEDEPVEEIPGCIRGSRPKCRAEPQVVEEPQEEEEEDDHYVPGWDDDWTAEDWRIWDMVIKAGGKNKGRKRRNEMFARFKYLMSTGQWVGTECHPLAREGRFEAKAKSRSSRPSSSSCQGG